MFILVKKCRKTVVKVKSESVWVITEEGAIQAYLNVNHIISLTQRIDGSGATYWGVLTSNANDYDEILLKEFPSGLNRIINGDYYV